MCDGSSIGYGSSYVPSSISNGDRWSNNNRLWARLCKCLGQDFLPYMEFVMSPLLQCTALKPDVTITSADWDNDIEDSDDERSQL